MSQNRLSSEESNLYKTPLALHPHCQGCCFLSRLFLFCYRNAWGPKLTAQQPGSAMEHGSPNAAAQRSFHIFRSIIHKETFFGHQVKFLQTKTVNIRLRLVDMVISGDQLLGCIMELKQVFRDCTEKEPTYCIWDIYST